MNGVNQTATSIMSEIREQVKHRLSQKYSWKRVPYTSIGKLPNRIGKALTKKHPTKPRLIDQANFGFDQRGRDVASGLKEYVKILLKRNVKLHTVIVLGSRAKGRAKPESDIDVTVIASNLPGKSSPEFPSIPHKILNFRRSLMLNDAPLCMGIQPSLCC